MTAPFIAEAERAAAEALLNTVCTCPEPPTDLAFLGCAKCDARLVVAAVVPILAEHFARKVGRMPSVLTSNVGGLVYRNEVRRVIREAATPTEEGTT